MKSGKTKKMTQPVGVLFCFAGSGVSGPGSGGDPAEPQSRRGQGPGARGHVGKPSLTSSGQLVELHLNFLS